jgi:hypothetical protein
MNLIKISLHSKLGSSNGKELFLEKVYSGEGAIISDILKTNK